MSYWNHVTRLLESTMDNRTDIGNAEKADLLRNELAKINTTDHFYVVVYNDCTGYDKHSLHYNPNKTLVRFRRGMCNAVIYASSTAYNINSKDYDWLKNKVEGMKGMSLGGDIRESSKKIFEKINFCSFVGLIRVCHNPEVRSTGHWEWGPGWWVHTAYASGLWDFTKNERTLLLVGLM